jgi:hypothetical protein
VGAHDSQLLQAHWGVRTSAQAVSLHSQKKAGSTGLVQLASDRTSVKQQVEQGHTGLWLLVRDEQAQQ